MAIWSCSSVVCCDTNEALEVRKGDMEEVLESELDELGQASPFMLFLVILEAPEHTSISPLRGSTSKRPVDPHQHVTRTIVFVPRGHITGGNDGVAHTPPSQNVGLQHNQ